MSGRARAPLALHARISADLAEPIRSGAWRPGTKIPYEHELMARYGCARATVGKAVQALAAEGLIVRRRKAGSFVAPPPVQSAVLRIPELEAEVTARGHAYGYELLSSRRRRADARDPDEAMLGPAHAVLELRCRHSADGRPFALEHRLIDLAAVPLAATADFTMVSPGAWLLANVGWSEAEHRIGAASADSATAEQLGLPAGAACLVLRRWTWRATSGPAEGGVTFARQVFPAGAFELAARFAPSMFHDPASEERPPGGEPEKSPNLPE